jgi:hypothetical protein
MLGDRQIVTHGLTGQTLMARKRYSAAALKWNYSFANILRIDPDGSDHFDYTKLHDVEPLAIEEPRRH